MTEARNFSGVSQVKLGYDAYGRLVRREHTSPLATGAGRAKVELYAHVGGLRVAVYSGNTSTKAVTLIRAIAWGPDLSGTVGGAGGIGGLLSVRETSASTSSRKGLTMLLGHDAKGDVTSVWSADGAYLGGYVTQAFGQVTILSGSSAYLSENQWRLASKPLEWLTGYSHWGRRWYSPFLGRWVSRDPIGENGGVNLYGSCGNDMVSGLDPWGDIVVKISVEIKNFRFANVFEKDAEIEIPTSMIDLCKRDAQKHAFIREVEDLSREIKKQALEVFSIGFKKVTKKTVWFLGGKNPYEFVVTTGKGVGLELDGMFVYSEITITASGELVCGCQINVEIKEFSRGQSKSPPVNIDGQASTYNLLNESDAFINSTIQATMRATQRALESLTEQVKKCTSKGR